jgi:hypothetical protein
VPERKSAPRLSRAEEARVQLAAQAGFRAVRDGLMEVRASIMRQLAELPRDGTADEVRAEIIARLDFINGYLPRAAAHAGDDDEA